MRRSILPRKPSIEELPVELLTIIFDHLLDVCDLSDPSEDYQAAFPFNVANTCSRWLDISLLKSAYWDTIILDLSRDPTPFLHAFDLIDSKSHQSKVIDVVVINGTLRQPRNSEKALENFRAAAVYSHLEKSAIACCRTITFDLEFQSSLPSAARILSHELPHLSELLLLCTEHDCDSEDATPNPERRQLNTPSRNNLPSLEKLDLTGLTFMELGCFGHDFLKDLSNGRLQLFITHFKFHQEASTHTTRSLTSLVDALDVMSSKSPIHTLALFDITFNYETSQMVETDYALAARRLSFDSVSSEFIDKFFYYSLFRFEHMETLTFKGCHVPHMRVYGCPSSLKIELVDIPRLTFNCDVLSTTHQNGSQREHGDSMMNVMKTFRAHDVTLVQCKGVTDTFLRRLSSIGLSGCVAPYLRYLTIHDCIGFTPSGIHSLVSVRSRLNREVSQFVCAPLWEVTISGTGPSLSDEEARGFADLSEITSLNWLGKQL
ncbi:hypothetical protein HYPSUDRAFT_203369 [Hypholoma sublateritium FD-334 SS-4]|uniref:F-box domain-containing protein n=1 Tax=Hypholoma sublateritium (strain FD-334 SS-4) TaxID=945553 RepID=A0A0D2NQD3_HYPSF|nr:hypothetical protein HYPSUDRAFT_203369 [Hypholoma sublateritium FD-334 SS-4]